MEHAKSTDSIPREGGNAPVAQRGLLIISHDVDGVFAYWDGPTDPPFDMITVDWDVDCHDLDDIVVGVEVRDESGITLRASIWQESIRNLASDTALQRAVCAHRANGELQEK